ncbi:hypothetical protein PMSM_04865 [Paenibacillus macquariensis subsp. macquariensis]|uniref:LysR substrate binding domain-containing protein n=2 Tax=Paenibacillus macquariensis TaxID=948756 RepID=A0ABY1JP61_9BACL|nr:hypothetical protein PMSM_04865 [Paenibacillus macquariensis subsp. macquariensis]SIQ52381.1 LysR substrate binding domain-containing protein [Paenibacillus macquariensis]
MREEGSDTRERLFTLCRNNKVQPPRVALQFSGLNETIHAVASGYGASFISSLAANEYIRRGELARVHVDKLFAMNTISLCTRKKKNMIHVSKRFIHCA